MPAQVKKRAGKWRVVHKRGAAYPLVKQNGKPVDGGGHVSKAAAQRQARAINAR